MARFHSPSSLINYFFLVLVSFFIIPSYAQDIEEVIVEAERQEANTLDVTESLDIFDLEDLEVYRITGLNDVANNVPGLTASPSGSQGLRFTLRGIGARDSQLGVESKIGLSHSCAACVHSGFRVELNITCLWVTIVYLHQCG